MTKKTLYEQSTGKNPHADNWRSVQGKPVKDFMSFKDAKDTLGYDWNGSMENALKNGSVRFHMISPDSAKVRMIYKPDVLRLKKILEAQ